MHSYRVERISCHDQQHGHIFVNKRQGTMLQFTGQNSLTVHVGHFLDFQSALQAGGILPSTAHQQKTSFFKENIFGELVKVRILFKDLLDFCGQFVKAVDDFIATLHHGDSVVTQLQGNHDQSKVLARVSLINKTQNNKHSLPQETFIL
jgi:hypothetical protein